MINGTLEKGLIHADVGNCIEVKQTSRHNVAAFLLYLGIVISPNALLFNLRLVEGFSLTPVRMTILALIIVALFSGLTDKSKSFLSSRHFRLFIPLLILLVIKVFSLLYTQNFAVGLRMLEWYLEMFLVAAIYFFYYQKGILRLHRIAFFLVVGLLISLFISSFQVNHLIFHFNIFPSIDNYVQNIAGYGESLLIRVRGAYSLDSTSYAFYLASMIIVTFTMALRQKGIKYVVLIFTLALSLVAISTAQSLLALVVLVVVTVVFLVKEKAIINRRLLTTLLLTTIILLIPFVFVVNRNVNTFLDAYSVRYEKYIQAYESRIPTPSIRTHVKMQTSYLDLIEKKPEYLFFGVGEGDYSYQLRGWENSTSAHNAFLLILGENGIIGLLAIVYFSWLILKESWKLSRTSSERMAKSLFYINLAFVLSLLLYGSTFNNYFFWIIAGLTFGVSQQEAMRIKNGSPT